MKASFLTASLVLLTAPALLAQTSIGLANYVVTGNYVLPTQGGLGLESSAVTYARDRGTLFIVGDEGLGVMEVSLTGNVLGTMAFNWTGTGSTNNDAEGLTYLGNGQLAVVDERPQIAYQFSFGPGGTVNLASMPRASVGSTSGSVGNFGTEGISFDPRNGTFVTVKQDNPLEIRTGTLTFDPAGGVNGMSTLFTGATSLFGLDSFSDVQTLSPVDRLLGTDAADHLLILSLDSRRLVEIGRDGTIFGSLDLSGLTAQAIEGVTVDENGNIYLVAEDSGTGNSRLFVLAPVPEPGTWALLGAGAVGLLLVGRWRAARL